MTLNESIPVDLGTYPGGGILRLAIANSGTALTTGVFIDGKKTPESPWAVITDATTDFTNLTGLLGYTMTDNSLDLMRIAPGVTGAVYLDCSRLCSVRVRATGYAGSDAACTPSLPSGFTPDIRPLLVAPTGAGLIGTVPTATLLSTDVQGSLRELDLRATAASTAAAAATALAADGTNALALANTHTSQIAANTTAAGTNTTNIAANTTALNKRLRVDAAQGFTAPERAQGASNLGLAAVATSGAKADVGLGNVDNTADTAKPVSTAQTTAINAAVATVTKTSLGLGSVDNTTDATKPVSTAQATAIALKANIAGATMTGLTITDYTETVQSPAAGAAFTVALANGTLLELTTNANTTITLPAAVVGKSYTIAVKFGGAHTLTFAGGTAIRWAEGGTAPTVTGVLNKYDLFVFTCLTGLTLARSGGKNY